MTILLAIFGLSILGMATIVVRHVPEAIRLPDERVRGLNGNGVSKSSIALGKAFITTEHYMLSKVIPSVLHMLEHMVFFIEKGMEFISRKLLVVRMLIRDRVYRFRIIPRESLYWREIQAWKSSNTKLKKEVGNEGGAGERLLKNEEHDISHHGIE